MKLIPKRIDHFKTPSLRLFIVIVAIILTSLVTVGARQIIFRPDGKVSRPTPIVSTKVATTPTVATSPNPVVATPTLATAKSLPAQPTPSVADLAQECIIYQLQTSGILSSAINATDKTTIDAAQAAWQRSFPSNNDRVDYINQIYTAGNAALLSDYTTYLSNFNPGIPNCSANNPAPKYFTLLTYN
jgi:hypothetical protein